MPCLSVQVCFTCSYHWA